MKNEKLFKLDLSSLFAFCSIVILALCIHSLIEIVYDNASSKSKLYACIRVVSATLLCVLSITNLRNKRIKESKKNP